MAVPPVSVETKTRLSKIVKTSRDISNRDYISGAQYWSADEVYVTTLLPKINKAALHCCFIKSLLSADDF